MKERGNKLSKSTKVTMFIYVAFILLCGIFIGMSFSALTSSKTATGTISFALTNSPEMTLNLNFVADSNNKTYLGTTAGAEISDTTDVLRVNIKDTSSLKIQVSFNGNSDIYIPDTLSVATSNGVAITKTSNANGIATFEASANVTAGDYVVLDKLLSAIYPKNEVASQNYEITVTSQAGTSVPATAKLSGIYSIAYVLYNVTITKNEDYGTLSATALNIPYHSAYTASGNTLVFKNYSGATINTVTATPNTNTAQYKYVFDNWSSNSGTITSATSITANFTRTTNQYTVTFYDYDGTTQLGTSTVDYGGTATYTDSTPTRPNDATYSYTFSHWVTTAGGSTADDLSNITANRNVYASYTATPLGYNININWSGNRPAFLLTFEDDTQIINDTVYPNFYFASNQTYTYAYTTSESPASLYYVDPETSNVNSIGKFKSSMNTYAIYNDYSYTDENKICDINSLSYKTCGNTLTFYICGVMATPNDITISCSVTSNNANISSCDNYNSSSNVYEVVVTEITGDITISFDFNIGFTCFTGDTLVWVDDGSEDGTFKRIDEIKVGEKVYSYNEITGIISKNSVNYVFEHIDIWTNMVYLDVGNTVINTTDAHMFLLSNGTWAAGRDLKVGDKLKTSDGEMIIQNITYETKVMTTYNLNVETDHTYFVTENRIIVHNAKSTPI